MSADLMAAVHERAERLGVPYCGRCGTGQVWPCPWASTLRALTLHQPWPTFIAAGDKRYETRPWKTSYRGWIALHASSSIPSYLGLGRRGRREIGDYEVEKDQAGLLLRGNSLSWPYRMPLGAIVAVAELLDCLPILDAGEELPHAWMRHVAFNRQGRLWNWVGRNPEIGDPTWLVNDITDEVPYGDFTPGRWAWQLGKVIRLPRAVPCTGHQGLWDLRRAEPDVVDAVESVIERRAA